MRYFVSLLVVAFLAPLLAVTSIDAQALYASNATNYSIRNSTASSGNGKPALTEKIVLTGKITNPAGVLPGAVIILNGTKQMAVTNADGEFQFMVPANAGPLAARVTYAGYADEPMILNASAAESTVNLTNARVIVVGRKQQLKTYLKTARKEVKRSLRQVRKSAGVRPS